MDQHPRRREPLRAERASTLPTHHRRARDLQVPWPIVLVAPLLAATPVLIAWALVGVFGSMANLGAATTRAVDHSSLAPLAGLVLGGATLAGLVVVGVGATEAWRRRGEPSPWLAPLTAVAAGCVLTPLALFAGAGWLAPRSAGKGDAAQLFDVLREACAHTGRWVLAGLVLTAAATAALALLGRFGAVTAWVRGQLDAWRAAADEPRPDPEGWRR